MSTTNETLLPEACLRLKQDIAHIRERIVFYKKKLSDLEDNRSLDLRKNYEERLGPEHMMQVVDDFIDKKWEILVLKEEELNVLVCQCREHEGGKEEEAEEEEEEDGPDVQHKYAIVDWRMALELAPGIGRRSITGVQDLEETAALG